MQIENHVDAYDPSEVASTAILPVMGFARIPASMKELDVVGFARIPASMKGLPVVGFARIPCFNEETGRSGIRQNSLRVMFKGILANSTTPN